MQDDDLAAIIESDVDPETLVSEESAPPEVEAPEEIPETSEAEEVEAEPEPEKKQTGIDKRFRKLTTKIHTLSAEKEELRQKAERYERQFMPTQARPSESDTDVDYDDDRLAEKRAQYFAEQVYNKGLREQQAKEQDDKVKSLFSSHIARAEKAKIEGYDEKVDALLLEFGAENPKLGSMYDVILQDTETGVAVESFLGGNLDEARRISELPPSMQAYEIGKVSARMSQSSPKQTTNAPPVMETAGSGGALSTPLEKITDIGQMMAHLEKMDDI